MPIWFWYVLAALIAALTVYIFYRHFFRRRGKCPGCGDGCASCKTECGKRKNEQ
ncbi:MAG: FeoB-associated Cys-rich membrane protein [Clostridia bacterium]|nr:FeoB-associated Cys-rich membrane protein [Clostridia bacterium]